MPWLNGVAVHLCHHANGPSFEAAFICENKLASTNNNNILKAWELDSDSSLYLSSKPPTTLRGCIPSNSTSGGVGISLSRGLADHPNTKTFYLNPDSYMPAVPSPLPQLISTLPDPPTPHVLITCLSHLHLHRSLLVSLARLRCLRVEPCHIMSLYPICFPVQSYP